MILVVRPLGGEYMEYQDLLEERCECEQLLCKIATGEYIEIKCRRCKRLHILPIKKLVQNSGGAGRGSYPLSAEKPEEAGFVALNGSDKFHRPDCRWAKKIMQRNRINFKTRERAVETGHKPCGVCKP